VRLRLALLSGGLFVASGAALLVITNALARTTSVPTIPRAIGAGVPPDTCASGGPACAVANPLTLRPDQSVEVAVAQHNTDLRHLRDYSEIALGALAVVSIGLGWVVAGRVLRPVRTITAAARDISASNLHERLPLDGPDDELRRLGETINGLLARLDIAFDAQRRFVANASHELRTPLARQRTLAQVALDDPDATIESLRAAHERVLAAGAQQERLIEALLTLARGEAAPDRREPVDLPTVVSAALALTGPEIQQSSLEVGTALDSATALGDPKLIERLVANLVDNAARHNVPGGRIDVSTTTDRGRAVVTIANTGPVVQPGDMERLFQPFQRMAPDRTSDGGGVGLGLSIVRAIAAAQGALVDATPRAGGGLYIRVTLRGDPTS
jgi:signal transduction histidine kinase